MEVPEPKRNTIEPGDKDIFTYYAPCPLNGGTPIGLFRFLKSGTKLPERLYPQHGWRPDIWLLLKIMSGDIGPVDEVGWDEAKAMLRL